MLLNMIVICALNISSKVDIIHLFPPAHSWNERNDCMQWTDKNSSWLESLKKLPMNSARIFTVQLKPIELGGCYECVLTRDGRMRQWWSWCRDRRYNTGPEDTQWSVDVSSQWRVLCLGVLCAIFVIRMGSENWGI